MLLDLYDDTQKRGLSCSQKFTNSLDQLKANFQWGGEAQFVFYRILQKSWKVEIYFVSIFATGNPVHQKADCAEKVVKQF